MRGESGGSTGDILSRRRALKRKEVPRTQSCSDRPRHPYATARPFRMKDLVTGVAFTARTGNLASLRSVLQEGG